PRDADMLFDLGGNTYRSIGRYADAVHAYDLALSLSPDLHDAAIGKGWTDVFWQGRLDTLRAVLSTVPQDAELAFSGSAVDVRAKLLLWERDADKLLQMPEVGRGDVFADPYGFLPGVLYAAWAHQMRGDHAAARSAFESARVRLESARSELPDDWRVH